MEDFAGLTFSEVRAREKQDLTNKIRGKSSRKIADILRANILTRFNALLTILAIVVISVGGGAINALFFAMMIINSGIGIFQELRAKKTLDKLAILAAPKTTVIREKKSFEIARENVVLDDFIRLKLGDQIVADGEIIFSENLEIDESLLTGESEPVAKKVGEKVLSGAIVVAGGGIMRAEKVGAESYAAKLTAGAKKFQRAKSELADSTNKLLKWISWILLIVAPILILGQLRIGDDWREAMIHAVAALVGMIPEGLVLLTSAAFMLAAITLARKKVLVQEMPAVETLARVDTLLLDKTGTLTEGNIRYEATILSEDLKKSAVISSEKFNLSDFEVEKSQFAKSGFLKNNFAQKSENSEISANSKKVEKILATIASRAKSPTNDALFSALKNVKPAKFSREIAFSSARKWSALQIDGENFVFGAPEILLQKNSDFARVAAEISANGKRVLALVRTKNFPNFDLKNDENSPKNHKNFAEKIDKKFDKKVDKKFEKKVDKNARKNSQNSAEIFAQNSPLALVVLSEKIRADAPKTLKFFAAQNVEIKIISGDSPLTVAAVARAVGVENVREFDARNLPEMSDFDFENYEKFAKNIEKNARKKSENNYEIRAENYRKNDENFAQKIDENSLKKYEKFAEIVKNHNVFGRVQPEQKRQIARVLQDQKHVVAMTGDGVNDALALKKADLGIAMNSGAGATKAVAEIVLLDNKFSHLPAVLAEGRRVIANIERVANLFVVKNVYSLILALGVTILGLTYPYLPIQMTVISVLSIGIPAFFLALAPNAQIYRAGFLARVLKFALPVGIISAICMLVNYYLVNFRGISLAEAGTSVSISLMIISLTVLILLAKPLRGWKLALILACGISFAMILSWPFFAQIFSFKFDFSTLPAALIVGFFGAILVILVKKFGEKNFAKK